MLSVPFYQNKFPLSTRIRETLNSGLLSTGPLIEELEEKFAKYIGSRYAVAVDSCTNGLFLLLQYRGDIKKISIPSMTFASVANVSLQTGKHLTFDDRYCVGHKYWLDKNHSVADSAHHISRDSFDGEYEVFSFYPSKSLSSAEGGMIATDDYHCIKYIKRARLHGLEWKKGVDRWNYDIKYPGYKMNMTNLQAAFALDKLEKLDEDLDKMKEARDYYNFSFGTKNTSTHLYVLEVKNRNKLIKEFKNQGIGYSIHFKPLHMQPAYKKIPVNRRKQIEEKAIKVISIPFFPSITTKQQEQVIKIAEKYVQNT